jgi:hypothetical protein
MVMVGPRHLRKTFAVAATACATFAILPRLKVLVHILFSGDFRAGLIPYVICGLAAFTAYAVACWAMVVSDE